MLTPDIKGQIAPNFSCRAGCRHLLQEAVIADSLYSRISNTEWTENSRRSDELVLSLELRACDITEACSDGVVLLITYHMNPEERF